MSGEMLETQPYKHSGWLLFYFGPECFKLLREVWLLGLFEADSPSAPGVCGWLLMKRLWTSRARCLYGTGFALDSALRREIECWLLMTSRHQREAGVRHTYRYVTRGFSTRQGFDV